MSQHRLERLQEEILHAVSSIVLLEVTDPLIKGVTLTRVVLTRDLGIARIYYEAPGPETGRETIRRGLNRARGFIRKQLAPRLNLRVVPQMEFFYDETQDEISRVNRLFTKL